jgi:colanic acid biosynthesis protein WcaH
VDTLSFKRQETEFIPDHLYEEIVKRLPIVSVEGLVVIDGALLFLKRNNEPAKGQWWFPGGRVHRGESLEQALLREVKEETGLEIVNYEFINVYSRVFPERHDITIAYLCKCKGKITLNKEHSEHKLLKNTFDKVHPYLLKIIRDSNWKKYEAATF